MATSDIKKGPLYVDSGTGKVGIGTSSPSAGLELNLASGDGLLINSADIATIKMKNTGGGVTNWGFATTNLAAGDFGIYASNSIGGDPIAAGTPRLYLNSSGNVGLGTSLPDTTPSTKLHIREDDAVDYKSRAVVQATDQRLVAGSHWQSGVTAYSYLQATNDAETVPNNLLLNPDGGSVGIGTASPAYTLQVGEGNGQMSLGNATAGNGASRLKFLSSTSVKNWQISTNDTESGALEFAQTTAAGGTTFAATPAWLINSSGNVGIGPYGAGQNRLRVGSDNPSSYINAQLEVFSNAGNCLQSFHAGGATAVLWKHPRGSQVLEARNNPDTGYIGINASAFTVSSDYRLKENIVPISNATERLKKLNPVRFNFKPFEETGVEHHNNTVDGFLAHEVSHDSDGNPLVPEAITGEKDGMRDEQYVVTPAVLDDNGNEVTPAVMGTRSVPDWQGIDQAKLTPLLTKALIEAVEKIEQLEARIAALEAN